MNFNGINVVRLLGRVSSDPERATCECFLSVVTDESGATGEPQTHRVVALGGLARTCARYLRANRYVYVEGPLRYAWKGRRDAVVVAHYIRFFDERPDDVPA